MGKVKCSGRNSSVCVSLCVCVSACLLWKKKCWCNFVDQLWGKCGCLEHMNLDYVAFKQWETMERREKAYKSFLLPPTDWRLFDDSRVSFCPESRVVNEQAYLLLYRRRDTPFTLHRLPPPSPPMPPTVNQEENGMEHLETEEATPMSISSASQQSSSSQPSSSSLEGEEQLSTTQEELD